jgi:XTP/dITP diphosphohydrolase
MKIVLATRNQGKVAEFQGLMASYLPEVEILSLSNFELEDIEETGSTFEANALLKAHHVADKLGIAAVADDSGLEVDALNGAPGIYSARYSGRHGDDQANNIKLLAELDQLDQPNRSARFISVIACVLPDGRQISARGELSGTVRKTPEGDHGFGYDPIFQPAGYEITLAEMAPEEKNAISHRGQALRNIAPKIAQILPHQ